jgi:transcriptional regulator with XRE-family HTH domain
MAVTGNAIQRIGTKAKTADERAADVDIGKRIYQLRTELLGMVRQDQFGAELGVTRGAVSQWESGRGIRRVNLERIAARFGVPVEWLMLGKGSPRTDTPAIDTVSEATNVDLKELAFRLPFGERESFYREMEAVFEAALNSRLKTLNLRQGPTPDEQEKSGI